LKKPNKNGVFLLLSGFAVRVWETVFGDGDFPKQPPKQNPVSSDLEG